MSWQGLLNQVLDAGQRMAKHGQGYVEDKLDVPAKGEARQASLDGMKTGAAAAGALALLLGTKTGRKIGGSALKLGSVAAVGGLAYQAYKKWQESQESESTIEPQYKLNQADGEVGQQDQQSLILLKAMLAAANADGHIDADEMKHIHQRLNGLQSDINLDALMSDMMDAKAVAALSDSLNLSMQIYLVSCLVLDRHNDADEAYRQALIAALNLSVEMVNALDIAHQAQHQEHEG